MGTRNLTCVIKDGKVRVAQYGQWDGYPSGNGIKIVDFINTVDMKKFTEQIEKTCFLSEEKREELWKDFIKTIKVKTDKELMQLEKGYLNLDQSNKWKEFAPTMSRDIGASILEIILNSNKEKIYLINQFEFGKDSLFCEWAYIVNLDNNTLDCYSGFNKVKEKQADLWYIEEPDDEYYGISFLKSYPFGQLPKTQEAKVAWVEELEKLDDRDEY